MPKLYILFQQALLNKNDFASKILNDFKPENEAEKRDKFSLLLNQYFLLGKPEKVLKYMNEIMEPAPTGDSKDDENAKKAYSEPVYTQARAYALLGKDKEALTSLKNMIGVGNNYQYLLKADHAWDKLRKTQKWKTIIHAQPFYAGYNKKRYQIDSNYKTVSYRIQKIEQDKVKN